jgi:hypothetical protein
MYDLSKLKRPGIVTFGMNNGPRTIRPNMWTCVDDPKRFIKSIWLDPCITKFVPHAHAEKKLFDNEKWEEMDMLVGQCPNMIYYHRNEKFMADRFLFEDTINWGNSGENGGGRSVMLPTLRICFLLGFRTVYLLGADFKMSENYTYHFDEQRAKGAINCNMNTYDKLKSEYLPSLKEHFDEEGFEIFNCNPESELGVFPFVDFEEAIVASSVPLGDVDNERTWGMYSKPEEREKWKNEPQDNRKGHLSKIQGKPKTPVYTDWTTVPAQNAKVNSVIKLGNKQIVSKNAEEDEDEHMFDKPVKIGSPMMPRARLIHEPPTMKEFKPVAKPVVKPVNVSDKKAIMTESRRIIRPLPCGNICDGSSDNASCNITIPDNGK